MVYISITPSSNEFQWVQYNSLCPRYTMQQFTSRPGLLRVPMGWLDLHSRYSYVFINNKDMFVGHNFLCKSIHIIAISVFHFYVSNVWLFLPETTIHSLNFCQVPMYYLFHRCFLDSFQLYIYNIRNIECWNKYLHGLSYRQLSGRRNETPWRSCDLTLTLYMLNFSVGTWSYIYILCYWSTMTWHR